MDGTGKPYSPLKGYADDIVSHCNAKVKAKELREGLEIRMKEVGLSLHPKMTKIVYPKSSRRTEKHDSMLGIHLVQGDQRINIVSSL